MTKRTSNIAQVLIGIFAICVTFYAGFSLGHSKSEQWKVSAADDGYDLIVCRLDDCGIWTWELNGLVPPKWSQCVGPVPCAKASEAK